MTTAPVDLDLAIAKHATAAYEDSTLLLDAGLESLSLLRLAVEVAGDDETEIDATRMVDLRTIGDLKAWLASMAPARPVDA